MKHLTHIFLKATLCASLFISSFSSLHAQTPIQLAQQGDLAYSQNDYPAALLSYRAALASGNTSPDLYFNLANTYYRLDSIAPAILFYERALRLDPSMDEARQNLDLAYSRTVDRITPLPRLFFADWIHTLTTQLRPSAWRFLVILMLILLGAAVTVFCLFRSSRARKSSFAAIILFGLLFAVSLALLFASLHHLNDHSQAIVMQPTLTVKNSPEEFASDKLILHEGTKVTISKTLAGHHQIILADGTTGWTDTVSVERI